MGRSPLAWRHATNNLGSHFHGVLGVESCVLSGKALKDDF